MPFCEAARWKKNFRFKKQGIFLGCSNNPSRSSSMNKAGAAVFLKNNTGKKSETFFCYFLPWISSFFLQNYSMRVWIFLNSHSFFLRKYGA